MSDERLGEDIPNPKAFLLSVLATITATLAATVTGGIALAKGDGSPVVLVVALWAIGPYVLLGALAWKAQQRTAAAAVSLAACAVICGPGMYILYDAFYIHIDAQNGLIFLLLPCLQWGASLLAGAVVLTLLLKPADIAGSPKGAAFPVTPPPVADQGLQPMGDGPCRMDT